MAQNNGKTRTLAFQISEEFFQRIKTYLEKESKRLGRKVTHGVFCQGDKTEIYLKTVPLITEGKGKNYRLLLGSFKKRSINVLESRLCVLKNR